MIVFVKPGYRAILHRAEGDAATESDPARRPPVSRSAFIEKSACVDAGHSAVLLCHCVKRQAVASPVAGLRKCSAYKNAGRIKHDQRIDGCPFITEFIIYYSVTVIIGEKFTLRLFRKPGSFAVPAEGRQHKQYDSCQKQRRKAE